MVQTEPPSQANMIVTFTNELIGEHFMAYDAAIKEVSISLLPSLYFVYQTS